MLRKATFLSTTLVAIAFPAVAGCNEDIAEYFPVANEVNGTELVRINYDFESVTLHEMKEPSIYSEGCKWGECIRLLWLRSFHAPITIRLEFQRNSKPMLYFKQLDRLSTFYQRNRDPCWGSFNIGVLELSSERVIQPHESRVIHGLLGAVIAGPLDPLYHTADGADWYVEYRKDEHYAIFQSDHPNGSIGALGTYLISLVDTEAAELEPIY